jgi:hypothetical protein
MNTVCLHLSDDLYESAERLAQSENLSLNQLLTLVLAEKVSLFTAEEAQNDWRRDPYMGKVVATLARAAMIPMEEFE